MADAGIKNVIIKKSLLGKVTSENGRVARFRIIAEDKNRKSSWSQIFVVNSQPTIVLPGDVNVVGNTVFVNWSVGQSSTQIAYDIFAGFDGATPVYIGSTVSQSYSFLKNGTQSVRVVVQISSINPALADVYDQDNVRTNILEVYSKTKNLV